MSAKLWLILLKLAETSDKLLPMEGKSLSRFDITFFKLILDACSCFIVSLIDSIVESHDGSVAIVCSAIDTESSRDMIESVLGITRATPSIKPIALVPTMVSPGERISVPYGFISKLTEEPPKKSVLNSSLLPFFTLKPLSKRISTAKSIESFSNM